ncbi:MAG: DUF4845 domain-containing protein [Casimicrobiaceae bacterium]|nr:DUF4845 domain-containing protein [Casimicrobiaceae bacterium]MCX8099092.1 DUF4845 domain-containing protein [Casimicrobiaceae bacterium]MDW8312372.1 DUF4845 domain-containing protein [Burkholderiales bacterium]
MRAPLRERGLSLIGFVFVGGLVAFVLFIAARALPAWSEYFAIRKVLQATADEFTVAAQPPAIRHAFDRRAQIDDIRSVQGKDLEINKVNGRIVLRATYSKQVPVVGNMSLLFEFDATATSSK